MEILPKQEPESVPVTIEVARPDDAEEAVRVHAQSWVETYPNEEFGITEAAIRKRIYGENNQKIPERIERYRQRISSQDESHAVFVARQGGKIVGLTMPFIDEDGRHRLGGLYTLKEVHGQGVGPQLLQKALEWHGESDVYLTVTTYNARAIRFYEKHGFEPTDVPVEDELAQPGDVKLPEIEMVRRYRRAAQ